MSPDSPEVLEERAVNEIEAASQSLPNLGEGQRAEVDRQLEVLRTRCSALSQRESISRALAALEEPIAALEGETAPDRARMRSQLLGLRQLLRTRLGPGQTPAPRRRSMLAWLVGGTAVLLGLGAWFKTAGPGGVFNRPPEGTTEPPPVPEESLTLADSPLAYRTPPGSLQVAGRRLDVSGVARVGPLIIVRTNDTTLTITGAVPRSAGTTPVDLVTSAGPRRLNITHQAAEAPLDPPLELVSLTGDDAEVSVALGDLKVAGQSVAVSESVTLTPLKIERTNGTTLKITGLRPRTAGTADVLLDTAAGPRRLRVTYGNAAATTTTPMPEVKPVPEAKEWPRSFLVPKDLDGLPPAAVVKIGTGRGSPNVIAKSGEVVLDPLKVVRSADGTTLSFSMNRSARTGELKMTLTINVDGKDREVNAVYPVR